MKYNKKLDSSPRNYKIGVDLGGTFVRAGLICNNKILKISQLKLNKKFDSNHVLDQVTQAIDDVYINTICGIGLGVPSLVDQKKGLIVSTTNIKSWQNLNLKKILEKKYGVPIFIDNDANCFILGVYESTQVKRYKNVVGLILGTGLGCGIIINGKVYRGLYCGAGEIGMIPYKDSILEHYVSGQYFKLFYNKEGDELANQAKYKEAQALKIFSDYGAHLAHAIKIILYTLAPEKIVLGGSVSESFIFFEQSLKKNLNNFLYPHVLNKVSINVSKKKNIALVGSALLIDRI